jgi:HEAT repeat protein
VWPRLLGLLSITILVCLPAAWGGTPRRRPAPAPVSVQAKVAAQLARLSSPDPAKRVSACWELYRLDEAAAPALPALLSLLGDERKVPGCGIYITYGEPPPLVTPAEIAAMALSGIGKAAVAPLLTALRDPTFKGRARAAYALGRIEDPRTREPLLALLEDADPKVRANAVAALGKIHRGRAPIPPDRELTPVMVKMADDPDPEVRANALAALGYLRDPHHLSIFVAHLEDPAAPVRAEAARWLFLEDEPRAIPLLINLLRDPDAAVRAAAARALPAENPRKVGPLVAALNDPSAQVRTNAATALGADTTGQAVEPLLARLPKETDGTATFWVAISLGRLGDRRAVPALLRTLEKGPRDSRMGVIVALGRLRAKEAVPPLLRLLNSDSVYRCQAVEALGSIGDPRAAPALVKALKDKDASVATAAAEALERIGDPRALSPRGAGAGAPRGRGGGGRGARPRE